MGVAHPHSYAPNRSVECELRPQQPTTTPARANPRRELLCPLTRAHCQKPISREGDFPTLTMPQMDGGWRRWLIT
jgi:hypothetical protein